MAPDDSTISLSIVLLAALTHASFQLSVSVLTLMSGHALGRRTAQRRLLNMIGGFIAGAIVMTVLLLSFSAYVFGLLFPYKIPLIIWAIGCGAVVGVGLSVWLFYYRRELGTVLWIPRGFARHLESRAKHTRSAAEAFSLGMTSIVSELLFVFAPIMLSALILLRLSPELQLLGVAMYATIALSPLMIIGLLIGRGRKISRIQRWRETNKHFLQFAAGGGLLILGTYVYSEFIIVANAFGRM